MNEFSHNMKVLARKNRRINNYISCFRCGASIFRWPSERRDAQHNFCSRECVGSFYKKQLKTVRSYKQRDYNQMAFGVSVEIAEALESGEWK